MKIDNLKELSKLIQLCRKTGVDAIEIDGIKLALGQAPKRATRPQGDAQAFPEASLQIPAFNGSPEATSDVKAYVQEVIKTDELSDEDLLFYSATGESN